MTRRQTHRSVVGLILAVVVSACGGATGGDASQVADRPPVRSAQRTCPTATSPDLTEYRLENSDLVSVAPGVHGRHLQYRVDEGKVQVYLGIDVADRAEDLDFLGGPEVINGREVVFLRSAAVPRILLVEWRDQRFTAPCDQVGVFSEGLDESTVRRIVARVEVEPPVATDRDATRARG